MAIKTGRYGRVRYNAAGAVSPLTALIGLDSWKLSLKEDYDDVTQFGDGNKVYVPGMQDVSGTVSGHLDGTDLTLVGASHAATPGYLELAYNYNDLIGSPAAALTFGGLSYLDADIDTNVKTAPKISASFRAAGTWTLPA
jgi:hypothetical protein